MLKVGVIGAGHLGKIHIKLLKESKKYNLIGFYDNDSSNSKKVSDELSCKCFDTFELLLAEVDVIDIVTPTPSHFHYASIALENKKHIFIEKPITGNLKEAKQIISLAKENGVKGQVGHVERFNPAYLNVKDKINSPMFIETHRLAQFNPRGTDVPVILDLMIHDIDIVLDMVKSDIKSISSSGISIISKSPDIANARIEFVNGCVANLTASRISLKNMRKIRIFQEEKYISIDFFKKDSEVVIMSDFSGEESTNGLILENAEGIKKQITIDKSKINNSNAILEELESLADSIEKDIPPKVTLQDGYKALKVALEIITAFNK
jgi:predicted dehydrogenase